MTTYTLNAKTEATPQLRELVNQWEKEEMLQGMEQPRTYFAVTNNVTYKTFECIRDNPNKTATEIWSMLSPKGFKRDSVATLISQMIKTGVVVRAADKTLTVAIKEFHGIDARKLRAIRSQEKARKQALARAARKQEKAKAEAQGIAALKKPKVADTPSAPEPQITINTSSSSFDADTLLSTLSFKDAITLYKKLKAMLGEV